MHSHAKWVSAGWLIAVGIGTQLALAPPPAAARTTTPTPSATPQRTGDLGVKLVTGRVHDASQGPAVGIAGATVETFGVETDAGGEFAFELFLHDTDLVTLRVTAAGFGAFEHTYRALDLWFGGPLAIGLSPLSGSPTLTPTPSATPQRTGDLGVKLVTGRVHDASQGPAVGIAGATVETFGEDVETDAGGDFALELFLRDTDLVRLRVTAAGFGAFEHYYRGLDLWFGGPLAIGLLPLSGSVEVLPAVAESLPCEGDAEVVLRNSEPLGGAPLTITAILPSNSYSQGDYGRGFTWDLEAITLPLTLAPGEQMAFPVHYSAAGQMHPSRLTVHLASTASESLGYGVPYRGEIAACGSPTPTPTVTPTRAQSPACAGDCDGDGAVTIAELVLGVALALGQAASGCQSADLDASGTVVVGELIAAVRAALDGCADVE